MNEAGMWSPLIAPRRRLHPHIKLHVGDRVGEWELLEYQPGAKKPERICPLWRCRCSCGAERWVRSSNLLSGQSKCCGHTRPGGRLPAGNLSDLSGEMTTMKQAQHTKRH